MAWCRCLVISMASITPLFSRFSTENQLLDGGSIDNQLLCINLHTNEFWQSSFEDANHLKVLETKWSSLLSKIKDVIIKRPSEENVENATMLLKSAYNFFKDSSCALLPSCLHLYVVPCQQLSTERNIQSDVNAVDINETNTSKKLLLWAYTLLHGRCFTNISMIIKSCEDTVKSKVKKGGGSLSSPSTNAIHSVIACQTGKDAAGISSGKDITQLTTAIRVDPTSLTENKNQENLSSKSDVGTNSVEASFSMQEPESVTPSPLVSCRPNEDSVGENRKILSAVPYLLHCNSSDAATTNPEGSDYTKS